MGSHNTKFTTAIHRMQIQKGSEKEDILLVKKHHSKRKHSYHMQCTYWVKQNIFTSITKNMQECMWFLIVVFNDYYERMVSTIFALSINTKGNTVDYIRNSFNLKLHNL